LGDVLASRLHADPGDVRQATPGERLTRPAAVDALESADGGRVALSSTSFEAPRVAGTFFFIQGPRRVGAVVVNPEITESRLERWSPSELRQHVVSTGAHVVEDSDEWVRLAFSGSARRPLVVPILIGVLLVLSAEAIAATTFGRGEQ
jgi:hypothetical protein